MREDELVSLRPVGTEGLFLGRGRAGLDVADLESERVVDGLETLIGP